MCHSSDNAHTNLLQEIVDPNLARSPAVHDTYVKNGAYQHEVLNTSCVMLFHVSSMWRSRPTPMGPQMDADIAALDAPLWWAIAPDTPNFADTYIAKGIA